MKYQTYVLTYFTYLLNHALRMCLSYNKSHIKDVFDVTSLELGIFDALIYISYGIGAIFRFSFFGDRNLVKIYLISAMMISCFFVIIPYLSIFNSDALLEHKTKGINIDYTYIIMFISFIGYGFFHLAVWQIMVTLMSKSWHATKDGALMGFWATNSNTGNISGFLISNFIVQKLQLRWEISMILFAILNLFMALIMYFLLQNSNDQLPQSTIDQQQHSENITIKQFISYSKQKFSNFMDFRLFIFSYVAMKAAVYSYLMWYPIYLYSEGFQHVSGYISLLFDLASMFGATVLGKLSQYEKNILHRKRIETEESRVNNSIFQYIVQLRYFIVMGISFALIFLYFILPSCIETFCLLAILLGFTMGGAFQVYASANMMLYGQQQPRKVDMISNFCISISCTFTGIFQLIIGLITNSQQKDSSQKQGFKRFFFVLLFLVIFSVILLFLRAIVWKPTYYQKNNIDMKDMKETKIKSKQEYSKIQQLDA